MSDDMSAHAGTREFDEVVLTSRQADARAAVATSPRRLVIIDRGYPRSALFRCPCGCGDVLVVNLDPGAGPAWRLRRDAQGVTLMPSVWRTSGCRSHFVLWRSRVWWCRFDYRTDDGLPVVEDNGNGDVEREGEWPEALADELSREWLRRKR